METITLISDMLRMSEFKYESTTKRCGLVSLIIIINFIWFTNLAGVLPRLLLPEAISPQFQPIRDLSFRICVTNITRYASNYSVSPFSFDKPSSFGRRGFDRYSHICELGIVACEFDKIHIGIPGARRLGFPNIILPFGRVVFMKIGTRLPLFIKHKTNGYGQKNRFTNNLLKIRIYGKEIFR